MWRDAVSLFRYPFPVGVDGFYYAQQIKSILANGTLYYPSRTPLVFYLIASVCGRHSDIVKCIKLSSIAIEVSLFLGFWMLLWRLTSSGWITWWGVVMITLLPSHLFLLADFTKELLCVALLAWAAVCIHMAVLGRRHWLYGVAIVLFLLAVLSHVSALLLLATLVIGAGVLKLSDKNNYLAGTLICVSWCAGFVTAFSPSLAWFLHTASLHLPPGGTTWWTAERLAILTVSLVLLVIYTGAVELARLPMLAFGTVALLALCVTANPWLDQNSDFLFGRASMTANLQLGLLVSGLLYSRRIEAYKAELWPMYAVLAGFVSLAIASPPQVRGLDAVYLRRRAELVDVLLQTRISEQHAIVIAPQGDQFAVTYLTGLRSQHSWNEGFTVPVYWLLLGAPSGPPSPPPSHHPDDPMRYILRSDNCLRKEWQTYDEELRDRLIENNPELLVAGYSL
ncbi:MAG: hypothetical protein WB729_08990 [Candidatus Sulfotelmatobacter sp.]